MRTPERTNGPALFQDRRGPSAVEVQPTGVSQSFERRVLIELPSYLAISFSNSHREAQQGLESSSPNKLDFWFASRGFLVQERANGVM